MRVGGNDLEGSILAEISGMASLRRLDMSHSRVGGTIPSELYRLEFLQEIHLQNATFEGKLSEDFRLLNRTLEEVLLNDNNFSGPVPQGLDVCRRLRKYRFGRFFACSTLLGPFSH